MAVTLRDVAKLAGVSTSAVSRTFTDGASVSTRTRAKVEAAAVSLGYVPSLIARSLATSRTKLVGLVANNLQNPLILEVFDLYTTALQDRGLRPLLVNLTDVTDPTGPVRMLREHRVDGVIVVSSTLPPGFAMAFRRAGVPVVHTFGHSSPRPKVHVVGIDNVASGTLAADALLDHGYQKVAFLGGPRAATSTRDREIGFARRLSARGATLVTAAYAKACAYDAGRKGMVALLRSSEIEAVFCSDDLICMGAMDAARDAGRRIPEDIGFLGLSDISMARWSGYNLTTIRQPISEIILKSVETIVSLIGDGERTPTSVLFPCEVMVRCTLRQVGGTN